ncbi:MAG TPA: ATP-binding protein [Candidatus Eisenbacteria bacterium]
MPRPVTPLERRALIMAPTGRDAALTEAMLGRSNIGSAICRDMVDFGSELARGAGVLIIAEEALSVDISRSLIQLLSGQPSWSDLPVLLLTRHGASSAIVAAATEDLGNVTLLERPVRTAAFLTAVRAALRARDRQYELRDRVEDQAMLAAIVTWSDDAMVSKSLDGIIQTWNGAAERMFGYTEAEAVGQPITLIVPADRLAEERMIINRLLRGERLDHFETLRVRKDGRLLDVSLTISPIYDATGRVVGASKVARDITHQKATEQALRDADRRKDEFLATLAHELRNPLAPIRNSVHILKLLEKLPPEVEHLSSIMERQINHMVRLVDDLMEVSRITRGKIDLRKEPVSLGSVLAGALETSQPLIDAANHRIHSVIPSTPMIVDGDPIRLAQVFSNLLNNAAKYTRPGGQIWLTVRADGSTAIVTIRDSGVGITREMLPRIFDLFAQDRSAVDLSQGGLGIGLTLVKSLVHMHGGTVSVNSPGRGQGSEFVVRLPLIAVPSPPHPPAPQMGSGLKQLRVLVVDDNKDATDSLSRLLQHLGAEVRAVHDGASALRALESFHPTLVLLDIGMPEMDGYEVARHIRKLDPNKEMMLIALTGWGQDEDRRRSFRAGFDHHLVKPTDIAALQELINSVSGGGGGPSGGGGPAGGGKAPGRGLAP